MGYGVQVFARVVPSPMHQRITLATAQSAEGRYLGEGLKNWRHVTALAHCRPNLLGDKLRGTFSTLQCQSISIWIRTSKLSIVE